MSDDFLGSVAQEDVSFITQITRLSNPGDNFYKLMVFIEATIDVGGLVLASGRFIEDVTAFTILKTGSTIFMARVTVDTYAAVTKGLLKTWLADFFASGHAQEAYLVTYGEQLSASPLAADITAAEDDLAAAYAEVKAYAYHKTICAGAAAEVLPDLAVKLAELCNDDKNLLSAAPYFPCLNSSFASDEIYAALAAASPDFSTADAFMVMHTDATRNGALLTLGLAFSLLNFTGTPVGNSMDFWATSLIGSSGVDATNLSKAIRDVLKEANIGFFKPVGDGTGQVVAVGTKTLNGKLMQAYWIVNYINYMCKVLVASYITKPNMMRNATTYAGIINIMRGQLSRFGKEGSGRLANVAITAPSFLSLPPASGDEIIVPQAWSAQYTDQVHKVQVYGNLIISE